ncbi:MAG TPA: DUF2157 domain-containing protein [Pyrinomonadaceae bacterium]|nr:DUF2157 domain-containing protein [Pyrinomonadaceae bacterium]
MTANQNLSTKFRAALRNELPIWIQKGIVSEQTAKQLSNAYQLDSLKHESTRLLSAVIFTIGGLLLGGGLISFVAANWEAIPTPIKLALLSFALISFHAVGFWLWHTHNWRRLGHSLILCGCLVFGANIGLVAQIFHISSNWYGGFGAWALGSLVMAWAVRSWIIGVLALGTSFIWFIGFQSDHHDQSASFYPLILVVSLLPLAWIIRSRVLYVGTLLGIITAACVLAGYQGSGRQLLFTIAAGGMFMWTLGELHRASEWRMEFANITAGFGLGLLAVAAYVWSFHDPWDPSVFGPMRSLWGFLFFSLSIAFSLFAWGRAKQSQLLLTVGVLVVGGILCASSLLSGASANISDGEFLFTVTTNLAALILAAIIIGVGLIDERRLAFWLGSLYLVLLILSRFLEYETSLLVKSAAFLACGVAVIVAGISYEKYVRRNAASIEGSKGEAGYE